MTGLKHSYLMTYYRIEIASIGGVCKTALKPKTMSVLSLVETPQKLVRFQSEGDVEDNMSPVVPLSAKAICCFLLEARSDVSVTPGRSRRTRCPHNLIFKQSQDVPSSRLSHSSGHSHMSVTETSTRVKPC